LFGFCVNTNKATNASKNKTTATMPQGTQIVDSVMISIV